MLDGQANALKGSDQVKLLADRLATTDDIVDYAREIVERCNRVVSFKGRNALEAYVSQESQLVINVSLGTGEEHEIAFRSNGSVIHLNDTKSLVSVMDLYGVQVGEGGYELPMPISSGDVREGVQGIIPTLVSVHRPKKYKYFWWDVAHCLCFKPAIEIGGVSLEGKLGPLDELAAVQSGAFGDRVIEGVFQHVASDIDPDLKSGVGSLSYSEFMRVLGHFDIWFNDDVPSAFLSSSRWRIFLSPPMWRSAYSRSSLASSKGS